MSKHAYYRSGSLAQNYSSSDWDLTRSKLMHVTHHIPKVEKGDWQAPSEWREDGKDSNPPPGSGGSLGQFLDRFVEAENGLDATVVWGNIKRSLGVFMLAVRDEICGEDPEKDVSWGITGDYCRSHGAHFTADLIVDSTGKAWVMEVHLTMGVKAAGLGDPEAGWNQVLTRETRQGVWGSIAMSFARFMDVAWRVWMEKEVKQARVSDSDEEVVSWMLTERRMSCRLGVESVFPTMWREFGGLVGDKTQKLYETVDKMVDKIEKKLGYKIEERKDGCDMVDFNMKREWRKEDVDFF